MHGQVYSSISGKLTSFELQSAAFKISAVATTMLEALEVDAPLTECTLKVAVSIPAISRSDFRLLHSNLAASCNRLGTGL